MLIALIFIWIYIYWKSHKSKMKSAKEGKVGLITHWQLKWLQNLERRKNKKKKAWKKIEVNFLYRRGTSKKGSWGKCSEQGPVMLSLKNWSTCLVAIIIFTRSNVTTSVLLKSSKMKQISFSSGDNVFATGGTEGLVEWIVDGTDEISLRIVLENQQCLLLQYFNPTCHGQHIWSLCLTRGTYAYGGPSLRVLTNYTLCRRGMLG